MVGNALAAGSAIRSDDCANWSQNGHDALDHWELNHISHMGKFCTVTQARPAGRDGEFLYAVKQLTPQWQGSQIGLAVLKREAALGRRISHPHLVPVLDENTDANEPFLVQPWLQGETLRHFLSRGRVMRPIEAIWVGRQVAEALAELEKHGYCHCDVKPANIMISPSGHVTLIDLGLARRMGEPFLPTNQAVTGSPQYMAPEQWEADSPIDGRADLYSLGRVMLEMLFGSTVFGSEKKTDHDNHDSLQVHRHTRKNGHARSFPNGEAIDRLESLLASMTAVEPAKRPDSNDDLVRQLISLELDLI